MKWMLPLGVVLAGFLGAYAGWRLVKGAVAPAPPAGGQGPAGFNMGQVAIVPEPDFVKDERAKAILLSL